MIVEGVNFNSCLVLKMKKRDFIDQHKRVFYLDRPMEDREKILSEIYDKIKESETET